MPKTMGIVKWLLRYILWTASVSILYAIAIFAVNPSRKISLLIIAITTTFLIIIPATAIRGNIRSFRTRDRAESFLVLSVCVSCIFILPAVMATVSGINSATVNIVGTEEVTLAQRINVVKVALENALIERRARMKSNTMEKKHYKNITFYYSQGDNETVEMLVKNMERLDDTMGTLIKVKNLSPLSVVIHDDYNEYRKATGTSNGSLRIGVYGNGVINLLNLNALKKVSNNNELLNEDILGVFIHEYFHHIWKDYLQEKKRSAPLIPVWFEEGLAEYHRYAFNDAFPIIDFRESQISLKNLERISQWEKHANSGVIDVRGRSYMAVYHLVENKGNSIVTEIVEELENTNSFDEAFNKEVGMTIKEFEDKFFNKN